MINNCPIYDYTGDGISALFKNAGFTRVELHPGKSGFLAVARK